MNAELTPRERDDMRDTILAGAQRLHAKGQRRMQVIAASVAFVLVAGISGGAVATAALVNAGIDRGPVATPSETSSPAPDATPTTEATPTPAPPPPPPPPPAEGVTPFGGECENALSEAEVESLTGMDMMLSDYRWKTGANEVLGGIDCVWVSDGVYLAARVHLYSYPASVVSEEIKAAGSTGCEVADGSYVCTQSGAVGEAWLDIRAIGQPDAMPETGVEPLFSAASARLADHPAPSRAVRGDDWWELADCEELAATIDPAVYGFERVALLAQSSRGEPTEWHDSLGLYEGATNWCDLHFTAGSGDDTSGEVVRIDVVPGGAIAFQTALDAEYAEPVEVEGALAAVAVPGLNRFEGSESLLVVTDGVNVLMVTPDMTRETSDAAPLAAAVLSLLNP